MRAVDIIIKKRDNLTLTDDEINYFIRGLTEGSIPDYQVSAWLMAILLNGMSDEETTSLTLAMARSGEVLDLTHIAPIVVDKHSTGGVGDKTTLVVGPIVAACGLPVGKMSGRGLGFSGGTLDKLESIPGFRVDLSKTEFLDQLEKHGIVIAGQSADLAPADGMLYALRDVTGTVPSIPLIASSVMSKKIAAGAHAIVLDVKVGNGAFMKEIPQANTLAGQMVAIGNLSGRKVRAVISDMNQPLGMAVGNAVELIEAVKTLKGEAPADFKEHCLMITSQMLLLGEKAPDLDAARKLAEKKLTDGSSWHKFREWIQVQGGNVDYIDHPEKIPVAPFRLEVRSPQSGYLAQVHAQQIGETAVELGAGRIKKSDPIDLSVGVIVKVKVGDFVEKETVMFEVLAQNETAALNAAARLQRALVWTDEKIKPLPLFYEVVG